MSQTSSNSILVTGAAGFIGHHVADALLRRGDRVLGVAAVLAEGGYLETQTAEISVGSTPGVTHFTNREEAGFRVTEIRPGTYVFYDATQVALGAARLQERSRGCRCARGSTSPRGSRDATQRASRH